ncbi:hypothetical protein RB195_008520 [Necator americanus]|uniref:C-type lectin domain-containing protein n=1 Tax=Necator americanus TaxID=51031 RepID=A0ABR1CP25_NECAM
MSSTSLAGEESQTSPKTEPPSWKYCNETRMCYMQKFNIDSTRDEAEKYCNAYNGHLASIHSKEQNQFLLGRFEGPCDPSLREKHWLDGSEVNFQNWSEEQPNNLECNENSVLLRSGNFELETQSTKSVWLKCRHQVTLLRTNTSHYEPYNMSQELYTYLQSDGTWMNYDCDFFQCLHL